MNKTIQFVKNRIKELLDEQPSMPEEQRLVDEKLEYFVEILTALNHVDGINMDMDLEDLLPRCPEPPTPPPKRVIKEGVRIKHRPKTYRATDDDYGSDIDYR